jgi:hypothetical protein
MPERPEFADAPPRLLVAMPAGDTSGRWHRRRLAAGAIVVGLVLAVAVIVVALVGGGHGSANPPRAHRVAAPVERVVLPVVVGAHLQLARSVLQSEGFAVHVRTVSGRGAAGMVIGQKPTGGRPVAKSTGVLLTVSNG